MPQKKNNKKEHTEYIEQEQDHEEAEEKTEEEKQEEERCRQLIVTIRESGNSEESNRAFEEIVERLKPRIMRVVNRFNISGLGAEDIMQEALYALRYKAIKDYDADRGHGSGWYPFDKFAILCIRRHLATAYKSSYQNKKRILNQSMSLDYEPNKNEDDDLSLINIVSYDKKDVLGEVLQKEYYKDLMWKLIKNLSVFEKEVFLLYAQKHSYEEIASKINDNKEYADVNIKGVDNALSRIKTKARMILEQYEENEKE